MTLEVCAFNIQSCFIAEQAGASRIEFCADPLQGGVTPSHGAISYVMEQIAIPVFPMIRPRGGDFVYNASELEIMRRDILYCREIGCKGIATGIQLPDGRIDVANLSRLVEWAYPMKVTCHKVFDGVPDGFVALEDIITAGCTRVLTSGLAKTAVDGANTLARLVQQSAGRISIMPGGSVRSSNIKLLMKETGALEYHTSGLPSAGRSLVADAEEIMAMTDTLRKHH